MIRSIPAFALLPAILCGCATSDDPAQGGFAAGIAGISSGTYDKRIASREATVARERQRQAALSAELGKLRNEHAQAEQALLSQRAAAEARGRKIPPGMDNRIAAVGRIPQNVSDVEKIELYRRAVADARELSQELAKL